MRRKVEDVMTRSVAYATKDTPYKELIRLLAERRVSALPVVGAERQVLGVVSEADLLLKQEHPADAFQRFFLERKRDRLQRAKAHGATAAELMTRPAITVGPEVPVAEAARLLRKHLVRRLPVVDRLAAGRHREPLGPAAGVPAPGPRDPPGGRGRGDPGGSADGPGPIPGQRR